MVSLRSPVTPRSSTCALVVRKRLFAASGLVGGGVISAGVDVIATTLQVFQQELLPRVFEAVSEAEERESLTGKRESVYV